MYRLEVVLFLLASLPFLMATIYASRVAPRRKKNMTVSLQAAARTPFTPTLHEEETTYVISQGAERVERDFESLYSSRLLIPAFLLSVLYGLGFSLGLSLLIPDAAHGVMLWPFTAFGASRSLLLGGPAFAMVGAYTFNAGVLVRRAFMADFSKNVMWSCLNRLILAVGFSVFLHTWWRQTPGVNAARNALCFAIAFFPGVFITALRKRTRKSLGVGSETSELDIQLIQGIDVWKEERLSEEGIESVQNMATADIFGLLPKVHYPLRTIVDWIDQAIFIQRFPTVYLKWQQAGFAISAFRFAAMVDPTLLGNTTSPTVAGLPPEQPIEKQPQPVLQEELVKEPSRHTTSPHLVVSAISAHTPTSPPDAALLQSMAHTAGFEPAVLREALTSLSNDAVVRVLARLWQTGALSD